MIVFFSVFLFVFFYLLLDPEIVRILNESIAATTEADEEAFNRIPSASENPKKKVVSPVKFGDGR